MCYDTNNSLWVTWKEPSTRERFVIGLLEVKNEKYYFKYLENEGENNLKKAMEKGFKFLPAFPEEKIYESETLFYTFQNRLPNRKRKDVQELLFNTGLTNESSDFELLRETMGILPTDTFEFLIPINFYKIEELDLCFYVAGVKYYQSDENTKELKENMELELKIECENKKDNCAIEILAEENKIGYVPRCYSKYIYEYVERKNIKAELKKIIKDLNNNKALKIRIFGINKNN